MLVLTIGFESSVVVLMNYLVVPIKTTEHVCDVYGDVSIKEELHAANPENSVSKRTAASTSSGLTLYQSATTSCDCVAL